MNDKVHLGCCCSCSGLFWWRERERERVMRVWMSESVCVYVCLCVNEWVCVCVWARKVIWARGEIRYRIWLQRKSIQSTFLLSFLVNDLEVLLGPISPKFMSSFCAKKIMLLFWHEAYSEKVGETSIDRVILLKKLS